MATPQQQRADDKNAGMTSNVRGSMADSSITMIDSPLLARDAQGQICSRIATVFPRARTIVTLPGIHASQRLALVDRLNQTREQQGQRRFTRSEEEALWLEAVDLILEDQTVLIRPDPNDMELAFEADELLQELVSKRNIKFLHSTDAKVRQAIKQRGESWRIAPMPTSADEMAAMISRSRIGLGGERLYYYNYTSGTRFLTYQELARLRNLPDDERRGHLQEIQAHARRRNPHGYPEVDFFLAPELKDAPELTNMRAAQGSDQELLEDFHGLRERFFVAVPAALRKDDPANLEWRNRMFTALASARGDMVAEEALLGLSPEFYMQIDWLPSARVNEGELLFDPIYNEAPDGSQAQKRLLADEEKVRGFIFNYMREYGDLKYINIGRIIGSLANRPAPTVMAARRDVFLAQLSRQGEAGEILQVIRMQKWGVREHLDEGMDLLRSMIEAEDYTDYILDRRLGCRQLGMNLPPRITPRRISETYQGRQGCYHGLRIGSTYFDRDYMRGIATSKIPPGRLADEALALSLAQLLGHAAAPNMVVGRANGEGKVMFDDGDELLLEDAQGRPTGIVVADPTGAFAHYQRPLEDMAADYALPVVRRLAYLAHPQAFCDAYLESLGRRLSAIQQEYRRRRRAFDTLFKPRHRDPAGSFAFRWERALDRLDRADPARVVESIRAQINLPKP